MFRILVARCLSTDEPESYQYAKKHIIRLFLHHRENNIQIEVWLRDDLILSIVCFQRQENTSPFVKEMIIGLTL